MARAMGAVSALTPARPDGLDRPAQAGRLLSASVALAGLTVLAQIAYPLTPDRLLSRLSVLTVLVFATASVTHALATRGAGWTVRLVLVVALGAFAAEGLGVASGFPFGTYSYAHSLGPLLLGVPLLVPLAWLMMGYPSLLMARALTASLAVRHRIWARRLSCALVAGAALAAWDIFLDPQMVAAGHWTWAHPRPGLPGVTGVPLTNLGGWLLVGTLLMGVAETLLPEVAEPPRDAGRAAVLPALLLGWTWAGGVVGNAAFFHRPWVALWGGVALGLFVVPYLVCERPR